MFENWTFSASQIQFLHLDTLLLNPERNGPIEISFERLTATNISLPGNSIFALVNQFSYQLMSISIKQFSLANSSVMLGGFF